MDYGTWMRMNAETASLKEALKGMDYKTSKYADGDYTPAEWSAIVAERKNIRAKIQSIEFVIAENDKITE